MILTDRQRHVLRKVRSHARTSAGWYRAAGNGERVTLASLFRRGLLIRRSWRGIEGAPDAAHEYHSAFIE